MRISFFVLTGILLGGFLSCSSANQQAIGADSSENISIDNGILSVSYNSSEGAFSACRGERVFIKQGRFPKTTNPATAKVRKIKIKDSLGRGQAIRINFPSGKICTLALYKGLPFLCIKTQIRYNTIKTATVNNIVPVSMTVELGKAAKALAVLGCDGLSTAEADRTSYTFLAMAEPQSNAGIVCGWLTHNRGSGTVSSKEDNGRIIIEPRSEYGKLRVKPGETVEGETLAVGWFEDTLLGLEEYADAIAKIYDIKLPKSPSGYCTWYSSPHGGASDEKSMAELADFCEKNLRKFGFEVLQIDDKWQVSRRDYTSHNPSGPYPGGMKPTAEKITSAGLTAGIWFTPFGWDYKRPVFEKHQDWFVQKEDGSVYSVKWAGDCLDMTHPDARTFLDEVIRRITRQWGYKYIKIDGLWSGMAVKILYPNPAYRDDNLGDAVFHNPSMTNVEAYRDGLKLVREASGDDVYILGCNVAQNMRTLGSSFGLLDGMRVGSDIGARWGGILKGARMGTRLYFLHNRVWHNDPDCLMLRGPLTIDQARAWGSWIGISGQLNLASEWLPGLPADKLDVVKRSMPNHGLCGRPVDLFKNDPAQVWTLTAGSGEQRKDVIALFNSNDKEPDSVSIELDKLGLPRGGKGSFIGFDYWEDNFVGPFKDVLKADMRPGSCRIIAIRRLRKQPVLVGTSRHVSQGIVDVIEQKWDPDKNTLIGKSKVVGQDPYELRIFAPSENWKIDSVIVTESASSTGTKAESKQTGREIRVTINSPENREVGWEVTFKNN